MDFLELAKQRQSCRNFDPTREVEAEKIEKIIECVRQSPSACNSQPYSFVVTKTPEAVKLAADASHDLGINGFVANCKAFVIIVEEKAKLSARIAAAVKSQEFANIDIGLACAHIVFAAEDMGLSTCILGCFKEKELKKSFDIDKSKRIRLVVAIGYKHPADPHRNKIRKPESETIKRA